MSIDAILVLKLAVEMFCSFGESSLSDAWNEEIF